MSSDSKVKPVALVTGAAHSIGAAIAERLAIDGYRVSITAEVNLDGTVQSLKAIGGFLSARIIDLSAPQYLGALIGEIHRTAGRIDLLVNNAGITLEGDITESSEADYDRVMAVNLKAPWIASRACVPIMREQGGGSIINVSSIHAQRTQPAHSVYAASKGGLSALTRQLAIELAQFNIRVNGVEPGLIEVERTQAVAKLANLACVIPAGRAGRPKDVASTVSWLASEESAFVTGELIRVDGGSASLLVLEDVL